MFLTKMRYNLLLVFIVCLLALPAVGSALDCPVGQILTGEVCAKPTPEQGLELLQAGNASFVNGNVSQLKSYITPAVRTELDAGQHPYAIVLTCSDSRVPPEILFNKGLGEIFTVRVAGNIIAAHEIGSIEYAVEHLGANLIVVLGHEKCGAVKTAYDVHGTDHSELGPNLNSLISSIDPAVTAVLNASGGKATDPAIQAAQVEKCVAENAKMVTAALVESSPLIKEFVELGELKVVQGKYDLDDGTVTFVPATAPGLVSYPVTSTTGSYPVNWSPVTGATGYVLEESTNNGSSWGNAVTLTESNFAFNGKANGTYIYRVKTQRTGFTDSAYTAGGVLTVTLVATAPGAIAYPAVNTTGRYLVNWSPVKGATGYVLEESTNNGSSWGNAETVTTNGRFFSGKTNGAYLYRVKTKRTGFADSAYTTGGILTVTLATEVATAPSAIAYPTANTTGSYTVNWSTVTGVTGYVLEESSDNGVTWGNAVTLTTNGRSYSGKTNGNYMYRVKTQKTGFTDSVYTTGGTLTVTLATGVATAPGLISYPAVNVTGNYTVNWSFVKGATGFILEESSDNGATWGNAVTVTTNDRSFSGKANGTYMYRVKTQKTGLTDSAYTTGGTLTVTILTVISYPETSTTGNYTVSWSPVTGAAGYVLEESTNNGSFWGNAKTVAATSRSFSGKPDGTYMYRVKAKKTGQNDTAYITGGTLTVTVAVAPDTITYPATSITGNYTVSWSSVAGATEYVLEENVNSGTWGNAVIVTSNSRSFSGKASGTYLYRVKAKTGLIESVYTTGKTLTVTLVAIAPDEITYPATSTTGNYTVSWLPVTGATGYVLEESTNNGNSWGNAYTGTDTVYVYSDKTNGTYKYRVKTEKTGYVDSAYKAGGTLTVNVVATAPGTITYPASGTTGNYTVSWSSVTGASGYVLEESTNNGISWGNAHTVTDPSYIYSDKANGTYRYRVKTQKTGFTDSVYTTGGPLTVTVAPAPRLITYSTANQTGSYTVYWSPVTGATGYVLEESTDNGGSWGNAVTVTISNRSFSGKANGTYKYRVKTLKTGFTDSGYTTGGTLTVTLVTVATAPGLITYPVTSTTGNYTANWLPVKGATGYVLEESIDNGGSWVNAVTVTTNNRSFSGKANGTYKYRVKTLKTGFTDSDYTTGGTLTVTLVTVAVAPSLITYPVTSTTGNYTANWSSVKGATGYVLEESTDDGGSWGNAVIVTKSNRAFSGKANGTYMYRVKTLKTGLTDSVWTTGGLLTVAK